jgi:molybdopterin-containing oxidoreductase family membrane subunit
MAWFLAPIPNANAIWPNFRSPLLWDVFRRSRPTSPFSALFWYTGMVPDLATLRDRAKSRVSRFLYGILALGWRGSNRNWRHYEMAYLLLAGLSTPLVLSVHSVVSFDFATSILPGWHTTIFPPYFVAGAIFGGFAMVLTILLPARLLYPQLDDLITRQHVDKMAKIILLTGSIVGYAYLMELFIAYYGANKYELFTFLRARIGNDNSGWYSWAYYCMMSCNVLAPQVFWWKKARENYWIVFAVCMAVNAGMWFERFVIIVTSLAQDFLPSSWGHYTPSWVEIWTFIGTFGIFLSLFLLFMKFLPMIAMSEVKLVIPRS